MKVLELTGEPILSGGQEAFFINVMKHINMDNMCIDVLTLYNCENSYYRQIIEKLHGSLFELNLTFNPGGLRANILIPLIKFLRIHKYDVVHVHSGSVSVLTICTLACKVCGVKNIIVHSHCTGFRRSFKYNLIKFFSYPVLRYLPNQYCACSYEAGMWKFPKRVVQKKLRIINNGIDLDLFSPCEEMRRDMRSRLKLSNDTLVLGNVGRFAFQKNHEYLIRLLKILVSQKSNVKLLLVGDGELMDDVVEQVSQNELEDYVIFTGNVDKVQDYMQAMDIFLFPSRFEGLGLVGVEAQAVGVPVIASEKVPRTMKIVDDVYFLPLSDMNLWMEKIQECSRHDRAYNKEAIKRAGYDINQTAEEIRKLYFKEYGRK